MSNCVKSVGGVEVGENVFILYILPGYRLSSALLFVCPGFGLHSCNLPAFGPGCRFTGGRADDDGPG